MQHGAQHVTLAAGLRYIDLPNELVQQNPTLAAFLRREAAHSTLASPELAEAVAVLEEYKCLQPAVDQPRYTALELKEWFSPVAEDWYRSYYQHPVWRGLRERSLSASGVITWVIHNYHISRAAGISDARCASSRKSRQLFEVFAKNTLEEYWHCDAFYFVRHQGLSVSDEQVKAYVPTAASLAFEQLTYQLAERDWVAHSLVTLFQESSIKFYDEARAFYTEVEREYELKGFFDSWVRHMDLDRTYGHVDMVGGVFTPGTLLTRRQGWRALGMARAAFEFLRCALDDILVLDARGLPCLRLPVQGARLDPEESALVRDAGIRCVTSLEGVTPATLGAVLVDLGVCVPPEGAPPQQIDDRDYLWHELTRSLLRAAGRARSHDEVVTFGNLARKSFADPTRAGVPQRDCLPHSVWALALANLFHETSVRPLEHAFLCSFVHDLGHAADPGAKAARWLPIDATGAKSLIKLLMVAGRELDVNRLATLALQARELFRRWYADAGFDLGADFGFEMRELPSESVT